jgi:hypothetical protein
VCSHFIALEDPVTAIAASIDRSTFLRRVLLFDAATCMAMGLLLLSAAAALASQLALPETLLRSAGAVLVPIGAFMAWAGLRMPPSRAAIWTIILGNAGWVVASVLLLVIGPVSPNAAGTGFVVAQAFAVAVLAELEYSGLRRLSA